MPKKILLADDSITIQKVITITFASEDYELTVVGDGDSAVAKARQIKPDLIMADVAMPGKNGYEVCEIIKNDPVLKNTPVLLLAGTFEPLNKDEAARVRADDSIVKPFESQELIDKVGDLLLKGLMSAGPEETEGIPVAPHPHAAKPELGISNEPWAEGDFLGFPEAFEEKPDTSSALSPDLDFLEGGLFEEPHKEAPKPEKHEFADLEFTEEELGRGKPETAPAPKPQAPPEISGIEPIEAFGAEFKAEPQKEEPFDLGGFEEEPFKAGAKAQWEEPQKVEPVNEWPQAETDLLEVPEAAITEEPLRQEPVEPVRETAPPPAREVRPFELPVAEVVERAAAEASDKAKVEISARIPSIVASVLSKDKVDDALKRAAEDAVRAAVEDAVKKAAGEAVNKAAREVIEKVAWDVVPELAEEMITAELNKIREAFSKFK